MTETAMLEGEVWGGEGGRWGRRLELSMGSQGISSLH